jgi:hypothetical protein
MAEGAKSDACTRRGAGRGRPAPNKETTDLRLKFREEAIERLSPGIEYDGPLGTQQFQFEPDGFTHAAFDSIAHHGVAERSGGGEANARPVRGTEAESGE